MFGAAASRDKTDADAGAFPHDPRVARAGAADYAFTMSFAAGFVLFPNLTQLDFTGPLQVLHRLPGSTTHIVAKSLAPVPSDCGLSLVPTTTFASCPPLDLVCVPGGFGVDDAIVDDDLIAFVRRIASTARYITSVCTGAFILGAAGLLQGRRATTHWAYRELLPLVGATPVAERVVRDGNVFTGGGVTAGIDFALTVAAEIAGADVARSIQLSIEYDPAPPFDAGSPERAPMDVRSRVEEGYRVRRTAFAATVERVRRGG
jgi:cyclohexyl-isocyanide hydratase